MMNFRSINLNYFLKIQFLIAPLDRCWRIHGVYWLFCGPCLWINSSSTVSWCPLNQKQQIGGDEISLLRLENESLCIILSLAIVTIRNETYFNWVDWEKPINVWYIDHMWHSIGMTDLKTRLQFQIKNDLLKLMKFHNLKRNTGHLVNSSKSPE